MEDRLKDLEAKMDYIIQRLDRIEGIKTHIPKPEPTIQRPDPKPAQAAPRPEPRQIRPLSMGKLLAIISVCCFVLAGSFIVKLAISTGWLTPERQWALALGLGAALAATGRYFEAIEAQYRSYLSAAGVIVLYLAAYSSSLYFNIVSSDIALVLGMGVSVVAMGLFLYHRGELFALLTVTGTYLSLLLLKWDQMGIALSTTFFILWASVFSWFSSHFKSRAINLMASYQGLGLIRSSTRTSRTHRT